MWTVLEHRSLNKKWLRLPVQILKKYELWKAIVRYDGPEKLKTFSGFYDESLKGDWKGYRSSRLSSKYRVLYLVDREEFKVYVVDINAHDY